MDCAGGFVDGCTYSCSLYDYEKIRFSSSDIADIINCILQAGIVETQKRGGKYGNEITQCNNLFLFNLYNIDKSKDEHINANMKIIKGIVGEKKEYTPKEYEVFIGKIAEIDRFDRIDFMHYSTCCIKIEDKYCALTCVKEDQGIFVEIRVVSELRERLLKNLSAARIFINNKV